MSSLLCNSCSMSQIFVAFMIYTSVAVCQASTIVIVDSPIGNISGLRRTDEISGESYISFKGIPYAKPPVGELRFAKPQPIPKFDDVFNATKDDKIICPHPGMSNPEETEDCLILNIHTKDLLHDGQPLKKVLVFIHGGAFIIGNAYIYDPTSFVISQDVIVVTINYRLGILGFLSTENEASPGNYGLWDQTLAMRWVKDNIRAFGGDPDDVTLAGESAGSSSVSYQIISSHAKGLFTKAYPQSGTATSVFAQSKDTLSLTLRAAAFLGCWDKETNATITLAESHAVIQCLRQLPVAEMMYFFDFTVSRTNFVPIMDGDFISDSPANLLKNDDYLDSIGFFNRSYLIGTNNDDAGIQYDAAHDEKTPIFADNTTTAAEKQLIWKAWLSKTKHLYVESRLGEQGYKNETILELVEKFYARRYVDESTALIELTADLNFLIPALDYLSAASRHPSCHVYHLYFDYYPGYMVGSRRRGTYHGADLLYWFDMEPSEMVGFPANMSNLDLRLKDKFSSVIGQFTKTGNPGRCQEDCWPQFDLETSYYSRFNFQPWVSNFLKRDHQIFWLETVPRLLQGV